MKRVALLGALSFVLSCAPKESTGPSAEVALPPAASASVTPVVRRHGDVCQVADSDMCVEFDTHDAKKNESFCDDFKSGEFQPKGSCVAPLRIGSCRIDAKGASAIYYGGDNNDIHDSQEHCEETLAGKFTPTPKAEIVATWKTQPLTGKYAAYTLLMPDETASEVVGHGLSLERFTGYYGIILDKAPMSVADEKKDAMEGSEYFVFDGWVTDRPTKLVWRVKATKGGDLGYKFALQVSAGGEEFTCESLTVFDDMELAAANMESCASIARR